MGDFDIQGLKKIEAFSRELSDLQKLFPKEAKALMRRSGTKARAIVARRARTSVKKKKGNYFRSIKRGKVWVDASSGEYKIRVYSRAPHAHLIEKGHRIVDKNGKEHGFQKGYFVFDKAAAEINNQWTSILEEEFHKIMSKL
ncbi:HK97 gp10 family phage protein [Paenibacillus oleatilyticus]|uniref:HK97 gp10 family phage protein n=1 Tax=Paenibacillus oleatilyticus TaxID=2594886 RepID=UPI001C2007CF|nr:HK97 gp10 family phage protein [Paenibacillus oleatilyticus]MBU7320278.1 HK97 gp10 family phage protein [Paenibacillus oleatilyticus]